LVDPNYVINTTNLAKSYSKDQIQILRVFVNNTSNKMKSTRITTLKKKSELLSDLHYRVRDSVTDKLLFDFDFDYKSTKMSYDPEGMFFKFDFSILPQNKPYNFEFGLRDNSGRILIFEDHSKFVVE
jgi:hypothetical protein